MSRGDSYNNFLRIHDQAVYDWLNGLKIDYGKPKWAVTSTEQKAIFDAWVAHHNVTHAYIDVDGQEFLEVEFPAKGILRIFSSPQKAFATIAGILIRKGWSPPAVPIDAIADTNEARKIVPLPFCSMLREPPEVDFSRENPAFNYRHVERNEEGAPIIHQHPAMYKIRYQLDFWCHKKYTEAHIYEWIQRELATSRGLPRNELMMTVKHGGIWGNRKQAMKFVGMSDNSDLEPDTAERRELRFTATFELNATMFQPEGTVVEPVKVIGEEICDDTNVDEETGEGLQLLLRRSTVGNLIREGDTVVPTDGTVETKIEKGKKTQKLTFASASSFDIKVGGLKNTVDQALVQILTFNYFQLKDETANITAEIVNSADEVLLGADLDRGYLATNGRAWRSEHLPYLTESEVVLRITSDAPTEVLIQKLNVDTHKVEKSDFVNFTGPTVVGSSNVYEVDGLASARNHLVSGDLLDTGSSYGIIVSNSDSDPTATSVQTVNGADRKNVTTVITPKFGQQKLAVEVDDLSATLSNLVAIPF